MFWNNRLAKTGFVKNPYGNLSDNTRFCWPDDQVEYFEKNPWCWWLAVVGCWEKNAKVFEEIELVLPERFLERSLRERILSIVKFYKLFFIDVQWGAEGFSQLPFHSLKQPQCPVQRIKHFSLLPLWGSIFKFFFFWTNFQFV